MSGIALVTGAAGDLGSASARALARAGFMIAAADLDQEKARLMCSQLPGSGHRAFCLDVTDENAVAAIFTDVEMQCGQITVLAHLAGIIDNAGPLNNILVADLEVEVWNRVFSVNALGTFLCVREMVRKARLNPIEGGRIITFSSLAGQMGGYLAGAAYAASKAAIIGFTKNVAREVAPLGMTVNSIAPGAINSRMNRQAAGAPTDAADNAAGVGTIPMKRKGNPDEVGDLVAFLASPAASYITGQILGINGGSYM